jgi:hypothetical protein
MQPALHPQAIEKKETTVDIATPDQQNVEG